MKYGNCGTLLNFVSILERFRHSFSLVELEFLAFSCSAQMLRVILFLHSLGILHCDLKDDNWVLNCEDHQNPSLLVCVIDFGLGKLADNPGIPQFECSDLWQVY
jgi:serine/threonine protein kinase